MASDTADGPAKGRSIGQAKIVLRSGSGAYEGPVRYLNPRQLRVGFARSEAPPVDIAEVVEVHVSSQLLRRAAQTLATVTGRYEDADGVVLHLLFAREISVPEPVISERVSYRNRRTAYRVGPDPDDIVVAHVTLQPSGETHEFRLIDVSASGAALAVPTALQDAVVDAEERDVRFVLPGIMRPFQMRAAARNWIRWSDARDLLRCGLDFEAEGSPRFEEQQDAIIDWVMGQQRKALRRTPLKDGAVKGRPRR